VLTPSANFFYLPAAQNAQPAGLPLVGGAFYAADK